MKKTCRMRLKGRSHEVIALVRYVKENGFYDGVADGLRSAFEYDKTYFDKIVASLLPLMEKLISGKIASLISPDYADAGRPPADHGLAADYPPQGHCLCRA